MLMHFLLSGSLCDLVLFISVHYQCHLETVPMSRLTENASVVFVHLSFSCDNFKNIFLPVLYFAVFISMS